EDGVAFARTAAAAGTVLVRNEDAALPLDASALRSVAVIGHNAVEARTQGGGSATVIPEHVVTPLDGIRAALGDGVDVRYARGAVVQKGIQELPLAEIRNPRTGEPGALVRFLDADGQEMFTEDRRATTLMYFGGDAPTGTAAVIEITTRWTPAATGEVLFGFSATGRGRVHADGELLREDGAAPVGMDLGASLMSPPSISAPLEATAGQPVDLKVEFELTSAPGGLAGILGITVGLEADESEPERLLDEAVEAATGADVAIVVVGTNAQVESEGFDRDSLALPGRQDELVRRVAAANPRTIVVVNSGSPVLLPWRDDVRAVLLAWFGGQEFGGALADVLFGDVEPGGRLPTTWPATEEDIPVRSVTPVDGKVVYDEGIHVGYRAWLRSGATPAYAFGHGLGYTTHEVDDLRVAEDGAGGITATVRVTNTGDRAGKQVVQAYLSRGGSAVDRAVRWLAGFASVELAAGASAEVEVAVGARTFAHWDGGWRREPGAFRLHVGTSVTATPLEAEVDPAA
ncbi:glycosyl hydrolase, partial [Clavibacter californiensis]